MAKQSKPKGRAASGLVMGGGVGVATLEGMFNMVNTQSLIAANMVRDFEMSQPLQMQALARSLADLLNAGRES